MSDPKPEAPKPEGKKEEKKTLAEKLGGALLAVLLVGLFLTILPSLLILVMDGATNGLNTVGVGMNSFAVSIGNAHLGFQRALHKLLEIAFVAIIFLGMGAFVVYLFKKIIKTLKENS